MGNKLADRIQPNILPSGRTESRHSSVPLHVSGLIYWFASEGQRHRISCVVGSNFETPIGQASPFLNYPPICHFIITSP